MLVQLAEFAVIVVCSTEIAGMVYDTLLVQQIKFGVQGIQRSGHRICIGHIHDGGYTTCGSRTAFGEDVRFVGQPGIAKMYMVVDDARQQIASGGIYGLVTRGGERFPVGQYLCNAPVFYHYGTFHGLSFVDNRSVMYQCSFHIFLIFIVNPYHSITYHFISLSTVGYLWNQLFHFNRITPNTASPKILLFILEVPSSRLMKMTGTSFTLKPHL